MAPRHGRHRLPHPARRLGLRPPLPDWPEAPELLCRPRARHRAQRRCGRPPAPRAPRERRPPHWRPMRRPWPTGPASRGRAARRHPGPKPVAWGQTEWPRLLARSVMQGRAVRPRRPTQPERSTQPEAPARGWPAVPHPPGRGGRQPPGPQARRRPWPRPERPQRPARWPRASGLARSVSVAAVSVAAVSVAAVSVAAPAGGDWTAASAGDVSSDEAAGSAITGCAGAGGVPISAPTTASAAGEAGGAGVGDAV